jgi:hypothetical protein
MFIRISIEKCRANGNITKWRIAARREGTVFGPRGVRCTSDIIHMCVYYCVSLTMEEIENHVKNRKNVHSYNINNNNSKL